MIHFSRKILKRTHPSFSIFPRFGFSTQEAAEANEEKNEEKNKFVIPDILGKSKKKKKLITSPITLKSGNTVSFINDFDSLKDENIPKPPLIYSIEDGSDTEIGPLPIFNFDEKSKEPTEEEVLKKARLFPNKKIEMTLADPEVEKKQILLRIFKEMYRKYPNKFAYNAMKQKMSTQMKMFPHSIEEQTFDMPLEYQNQKEYLKDVIQMIDQEKTDYFKVPDNDESGRRIKKYRNMVGGLIFRMGNEKDRTVYQQSLKRLGNLIKEAFSQNQYDIMNPKDFRTLILKEEFVQTVQLFLNPKFFIVNQYLIGNIDVDQILKAYLKNPSKMLKNLEFVRYHKQFLISGFNQTSKNKSELYQMLSQLKNYQEIDYISFIFHTSRIYQIDELLFSKVDQKTWNKSLTRIYWGQDSTPTPEKLEIFQNHLEKLLFEHYQISSNKKLTDFFFDLIINSKTYHEGKTAFALTVIMLASLKENNKDLNANFKHFISTISQESFDFYIKQGLPLVLKNSKNVSEYQNLEKALLNFEKMDQNEVKIENPNHQYSNFFEAALYEKVSEKDENIEVFILYNCKSANMKFLKEKLDPQSWNLLNPIPESKQQKNLFSIVIGGKNRRIATDILLRRKYRYFYSNILQNFTETFGIGQFQNNFQKDRLEPAPTFVEFDQKFKKMIFDIYQNNKKSFDLNNIKNSMKVVYEFIKPYRNPLSNLYEKDSFDKRYERFMLHANNELSRFAEMRENYVYGVVDEKMIRIGKKIKRGYYVARKNKKLYVARVSYTGRLIPTNIPLRYFMKFPYPSIKKQKENMKAAKKRAFLNSRKEKPKSTKKLSKKKLLKKREYFLKKKKEFSEIISKKKIIDKKRLEDKPQKGFSTMKQINDLEDDYDMEVQKNDVESGFKVYLQKLKEIEERKKKEEDAQQKQFGSLSDQDLTQMKRTLFQEDPLYRSAFIKSDTFKNKKEKDIFSKYKRNEKATSQREDQYDNNLFDDIKTYEKRKPGKKLFEGIQRPSHDRDDGYDLEEKAMQPKEKAQFRIETAHIRFWNEKFTERQYELPEIMSIVKQSLEQNESIKKPLLAALSSLEGFGETPHEGAAVLATLLEEKKNSLEPVDKLKVDFVCQSGPSLKDYNNYLKASYINYEMPPDAYTNMFQYYVNSIAYNRKCFKRTFAHLIRFNNEISDETIDACIEVCRKQKLGMTLLEFIHLIAKNKMQISQNSVKNLFAHLKDYKMISEDIEGLFRLFLKTYDWDYDMSLIEPYLNLLITQNKQEIYMSLFEKIKEFLFARKHVKQDTIINEKDLEKKVILENEEKTPEISEKENKNPPIAEVDTGKMNLRKKKETAEVHNFYMDFVDKLNNYKVPRFSKLVFYDFVNNQFEFNLRDFLVGLKTFSDSGDEFLVIYNQFKSSPVFLFDETVFTLVIDAINNNPVSLASLFDEVLEEYVYTKKYEFNNLYVLNSFIIAFGKTQKFFEFTNFLRFLSKNKLELNRTVKITCYKVLGKVTDDMSKPYIKGLIDAIFDENKDEKDDRERLEKIKMKNEFKRQKKEAKKGLNVQTESIQTQSAEKPMFKPIIRGDGEDYETKKEKKIPEVASKEQNKIEEKPKVEMKEKSKIDVKEKTKEEATTPQEGNTEETKTKVKKGKQAKKAESPLEKKETSKESMKKDQVAESEPKEDKKKKNSKNLLDRIESIGKSQKTRQKKILQSRDTWERVNSSIPFTDDEGDNKK